MECVYSEGLISEFIENIKKEHGVVYTREQAIRALDSLSDLFLIFSKKSCSNQTQK